MNKLRKAGIPFAIMIIFLITNSFLFFNFKCQSDYIENRNYQGRIQSISKQSLLTQKKILSQLPSEYDEAIENLNEIINAKQKRITEQEAEELRSLGFEAMYDLQEYCNVKTLVEEKLRYDTMRKELENIANDLSQISIFNRNIKEANMTATIQDFYGVKNLSLPIELDYGINCWICFKISDYLVIFYAVILAFYFAFLNQKDVVSYQQKGYGNVFSGIVILGIGIVGAYILNFILMNQYIGNYDLSMWLQNFPSFYYFPTPMRLITFLFVYVSIKLLMGILIYSLVSIGFYLEKGKRKKYLITLSLFFILEIFFYHTKQNANMFLLFREINILSAIMVERFFMTYLNLSIFGIIISRMNLFSFLLCLGVILSITFLSIYIKKNHQKKLEELQYRYYDEINQKYMQTRQLWHDFQNHLLTIQELIRREEIDAANRYLLELEEEIDSAHILTKSGSEALDVLIYQKSEIAKSNQVKLNVRINANIKAEEFHDVAICCVVGNLIDNCIEAVKKLEPDKRTASIEIEKKGDMLYIVAQNEYIGMIEKNSSGIKSSKLHGSDHGFGLQSIKHVCEKYHGSIMIDYGDNIFKVQALMMANKK